MSNWRTSPGVLAFVSTLKIIEGEQKHILLTNVENKKDMVSIKKLAEKRGIKCLKEIWIDTPDKFSLKVGQNLNLFIKHPKLPEPETWYKVDNYLEGIDQNFFQELSYLIRTAESNKGIFKNNFEPIFNDDYPLAVSFINPELKEYQDCVEEMERRLNIELYKKTTKWELGHRYDTVQNSYYCLGVWKSRITGRNTGSESWDFSDKPTSLEKTYSYLLSKPSGITPETFWENVRLENIPTKSSQYFAVKKTSGVDIGLFMDPALDIFKDWRKRVFENTLEHVCKKTISICPGIPDQEHYENISLLLEPFLYVLPGEESKSLKEIAEPYIETFRKVINSKFLELCYFSRTIHDGSISIDARIKELARLLVSSGFNNSSFSNKHKIVVEFFDKIGLSLESLAKDFFTYHDPKVEFISNIENYIINHKYIVNIENGNKFLDIREKSISGSCSSASPRNISSVITPLIKDEIFDMIMTAKENYGIGISSLQYNQPLNKSLEGSYIAEVNVGDIWTKYYEKGVEIPEDLIKEIISSRFWNLTISFDESWKPE